MPIEKESFLHDDEEYGMTESQFQLSQEKLQREINDYAAAERNKPHHEYYIFKTPEDKQKAFALIRKGREYNEAFRFLVNWTDDHVHQDTGIAMEFTKTPEDCEEKVIGFFLRYNIHAKRIHHTDAENHETAVYAENPVEEEEELGHDRKVLQFPSTSLKKPKTPPDHREFHEAA